MPRPKKTAVRYLKHPCGRARALWNDATGARVRMLPGAFDSPESLQAFARLQLEVASSPAMPKPSANGPTLVEVLSPYLRFAGEYYGESAELEAIKSALKTARELYGSESVADFGPRRLASVREAFVQKGWARQYCNRQVAKIIRAMKWAVAEELVPAAIYQALKALAPLRRGHTPATETQPRLPANPEHVATTLPFLPPHVRAIVELLRATGMRPAEACRMSLEQIDRMGTLWIYRLKSHKNAHRGHHRNITLGANAQTLLSAYLEGRTIGDAEPLFSPKRQRAERSVKTWKPKPNKSGRILGDFYTVPALGRAITVGAKKAGVSLWSAYQLRHLKGAELLEKFSLKHVRATLGHANAVMSRLYTKGADALLAAEVAAKVG